MLICKLIDSIWATRKYEELDGMKLMRVEVIDGPESGRRLVCVDTISGHCRNYRRRRESVGK